MGAVLTTVLSIAPVSDSKWVNTAEHCEDLHKRAVRDRALGLVEAHFGVALA